MIEYEKALMIWNPTDSEYDGPRGIRMVEAVKDDDRRYACSDGACYLWWNIGLGSDAGRPSNTTTLKWLREASDGNLDATDLIRTVNLFRMFIVRTIRDGMDPEEVHRELLKVAEYHRLLPIDVPGVRRFAAEGIAA